MSAAPAGSSPVAAVAPVAIQIVTHDSAADLPAAMTAIAALTPRPTEIVVVDCASGDGSAEVAREHAPAAIPLRIEALGENRGFAGGMNRGFELSTAPFVLTLNADAAPERDFLARLLARCEGEECRVAAATGRLVRPPAPGGERLLDACGMRLTRSWRHLDRGSGEIDRGQYGRAERVFGATGAATLFRRAALDDVAIEGRIFDDRFHSFREDAELAFRFAERGWQVVYAPDAVAIHRRRVVPERRAALPPMINFHSLKNRYLLRIDHQSAANFVRTLPWTLGRDLAALGYVLLRERSSLPVYGWLWRHRRELVAHRRMLRRRITAPRREIERWFGRHGEAL
ncbi:MAG: glycosyltransferase family 2 protein [Thermoanaerobaculia bacterium]